jgi:hypothetical protein
MCIQLQPPHIVNDVRIKKQLEIIICAAEYFSYVMMPETAGINNPSKGMNRSLN